MNTEPIDYLTLRGLSRSTPEALNDALRVVLNSMEATAFGDANTGLTAAEQTVLREGGLTLEPTDGPDPLAQTAVKYAAILKRSLSTKQASERLGVAASRIRQMIADRSLYSFLIDGSRYIPEFQFEADGRLIPNVTLLNKALNPRMLPVEVYNWLHLANVDLFLDDDMGNIVSPFEWLKGGQDLDRLLLLASRL